MLPNATAAWTQIGKKIRASRAQDSQPAVHVLKTDDGPSLERRFNGVRSPLKSGAEGEIKRAPNIIFFLTDDQDILLGGALPTSSEFSPGATPLPRTKELMFDAVSCTVFAGIWVGFFQECQQ